jgi:hypothetical protein
MDVKLCELYIQSDGSKSEQPTVNLSTDIYDYNLHAIIFLGACGSVVD